MTNPSPVVPDRSPLAFLVARVASVMLVIALSAALSSSARAADYYVNVGSGSCSNAGPGTQLIPFCSISAAIAAHSGPGVTIWVLPGTYREQVTVPASGAAGNPFTIKALGGPVLVDGADDFSSAVKWAPFSGDVWLASSVNWSPKQVFADGARLASSTASPSLLPSRSFRYVAGTGLCVNAGGGNPGSHQALVGRRSNAFVLTGKSWVTIDGITAIRAEDRAFNITSLSSHVTLTRNIVKFAGRYGIYFSGGSGELVEANVCSDNADHGIEFISGVTGSTLRANECFRNVYPPTREANGIYVYSSPSNLIERNLLHDNQDTGLQINQGSNNCVCLQNVSWNNGDHGYDHLMATGTLHIGDVAYGNYKDGFSIEGSASGVQLYDCIAIENGLTTNEFNLWVDLASSSGFVSDYNIFWNSTSQQPVKYIATLYSSVAAYSAATGKDQHSIQANPLFTSPTVADFHLGAGSPAIDAGTSAPANWPALDADGNARVDIGTVPNSGAGPVPYADRGAFEFRTVGVPPVAQLIVSPANGRAPLAVSADASGSTDPNGGGIVSYRFDFGDGTVVGPQAGATATHPFSPGTWTVTVTVVNSVGLAASASQLVLVNRPPVAKLTLTPSSGVPPLNLTADASGSSDPEGGTLSYRFDFGDGTLVGPQASPVAPHGYPVAGTFTVMVTVADSVGDTGTATSTATVADHVPVVTAPALVSGRATTPFTVSVSASDPDGQAILSLSTDLSQLPAGNSAVFTESPDHTSGTLAWTPGAGDSGSFAVTFTASNALSGSAATTLQVLPNHPNQPPMAVLSVTPASGNAPLAVTANGSGSSDPDGSVASYRFDFGDGTVVGPQVAATAPHSYAAGNWTVTLQVTDNDGATAGATASVSVAASATNLVGNPSFESGTTGWNSYSGATLLRVSGGFDGGWALQVTGTATTTSFGANDSPNWVANAGTAGSSYRFGAWVRSATSAGTAKLQIREYLNGVKVGSTVLSTGVKLSPSWQFVTADFLSGATGSTLDYQVVDYPAVSTEVFQTDNVSIYKLAGGAPAALTTLPSGQRPGTRADPARVAPVAGDGTPEPEVRASQAPLQAAVSPNPLQPGGVLSFVTTRTGPLLVQFFDVNGREVGRPMDAAEAAAGPHQFRFGAGMLPHVAGVYFYRIRAAEATTSGRFLFVR